MHDTKFHVTTREPHDPLGDDEPAFVLRGRDKLAADAILGYAAACREAGCPEEHLTQVHEAVSRFDRFAEQHPDRMKLPD